MVLSSPSDASVTAGAFASSQARHSARHAASSGVSLKSIGACQRAAGVRSNRRRTGRRLRRRRFGRRRRVGRARRARRTSRRRHRRWHLPRLRRARREAFGGGRFGPGDGCRQRLRVRTDHFGRLAPATDGRPQAEHERADDADDRHDHERDRIGLHDAAEEEVEVEDDAEQQPREEPADRVALHRGLARITSPTLRIAKKVSTSEAMSTGLRDFEPEISTVTAPVHTTLPRSEWLPNTTYFGPTSAAGKSYTYTPWFLKRVEEPLQCPLPISISPNGSFR